LRFFSAAAALAIFIAAWAALHQDRFKRGEIVDTPVYQNYGDAMWRGEVPYRDFAVEYPPGALPFFVLPAYKEEGNVDSFRQAFEALIAACMAVLLFAMALSLAALRASPLRTFGALALAAVAPLLLGSVILSRFDLWPATLVALAMAALLSGRLRLGHAVLGAGFVAKIWPGVLIPLAVAYAWRKRGRTEGLVCLGIAAAVVVVVFLPFFVLSPHGVLHSLQTQTTRPLQIETLGAALIVASHHLFGTGVVMSSGHGSQNIGGTAANVVAGIQTAIQIGALLAIWIVFARRERSGEDLVRYSAAAVVAFIALGKVLSPQFLIWLIPLVPLVRRWSAAVFFAVALVLTQAWFPQHYWDYALRFDETRSWLVLWRDVTLVALLGVLVAPPGYLLRLTRLLRPRLGSDPRHGRSEQNPA
jgi:hypothetical protein